MATKVCPKCGTENIDLAWKCKSCGTEFVSQQNLHTKPKRSKKANDNIYLGIFLIAISLCNLIRLATGKFELTSDASSYGIFCSPILLIIGIGVLVKGLSESSD